MGELSMVSMSFDPLNGYPEMEQEDLLEALGFLPHWAVMYDATKKQTLREHMEEQYKLPITFYNGGTVLPDERFHYPGDEPDLYPLCVIVFNTGQKFIQYIHGMVSFLDFNSAGQLQWYHGRMD